MASQLETDWSLKEEEVEGHLSGGRGVLGLIKGKKDGMREFEGDLPTPISYCDSAFHSGV